MLTIEQYLASTPVVVTQQEKDTLLASVAAETWQISLVWSPFCVTSNLPFISFNPPSPLVSQLIKCPICHKGIKDPKTLPCLHSFCQKCLEKREFDRREMLRCEVCKTPYEGVKNLGASVFIESLSRSLLPAVKNVNKVKCEGCSEENATMHCADCGQNMGPSCAGVHRKMKVSASHQLVPLHDALK